MSRKYTNRVLELIDEGIFDVKEIAIMALNALSEDEVEEMCRANDIISVMYLEDEDKDAE